MSDPKVLVVRDPIKLGAKQHEFMRLCEEPGAKEILFSGSIRGGKSQACARKTVEWAWKYGGKHLCVRRTYRQLEDSTKAIFLRGDGGLPPACPPELIARTFEGEKNMILLKNGAEILFRSAENAKEAAENIRNVTLGSVFIDQIEELDDDAYKGLYKTYRSRCSDPRGPRKVIAAANPGPETHWAWERFHPDSEQRDPRTRYVNVTIYDNADNLPEGYVEDLEKEGAKDPLWFDRFCLGKWGAFGGKRFRAFNPKAHVVKPFTIPGNWEIIEGIDYGQVNPFVVEWIAVSPEERYHVFAEYWATDTTCDMHAKKIRARRQQHNVQPDGTWMDPSAFARSNEYASPAADLQEAGIDVAPADNDRLGGWNHLDQLLRKTSKETGGIKYVNADGEPLEEVPMIVFMDGRCRLLLKELPNARHKENPDGSYEDDIEKKNDHALDATRYILNARPPAPEEAEEEDFNPHEAYANAAIKRALEREGIEYVG